MKDPRACWKYRTKMDQMLSDRDNYVTVFLPADADQISFLAGLTPCKFAILFKYDLCVITCGEELHVPLGGL
jgi:hypothetical protein